MKKITCALILFMGLAANSNGQDNDAQKAIISTKLVYQNWSPKAFDDFNEFSLPFYLYYPVGDQFSVTLRGYQASVTGDNAVAGLSGLTDTQLGLSYFLNKANLVLNLGINAPTGKNKLTVEEFQTSTLISNNLYNMQVANFGQGLNVSAGLAWAIPATESLVLGLGAAYQFKGNYKPIAGFVEDYAPGDEILATAGFELQLGETASISSDAVLTFFATDKLGGEEIFSAGNRIVMNAQFKKFFNFSELRLQARYRTRAKNEIAVAGGGLATEAEKTFPTQLEVMGRYRWRLSETFYAGLLAEGRLYQEAPGFVSFETTPASAGANLIGLGLAPEWIVSDQVRIPVFFKYFSGSFDKGSDISGFEIGAEFLFSL